MQFEQLNKIWIQGLKEDVQKRSGEVYNRSIASFQEFPKSKAELEKQWQVSPVRKEVAHLSAFYALVTALSLDWKSESTLLKIVFGSLLQDVGLGAEGAIAGMKKEARNEKQKILFDSHCTEGVKLLDQLDINEEAVKQIVYQHHEYFDGTGWPNAFAGSKIYGLAGVVSFASDLAEVVINEKMTLLQALKKILGDKEMAGRYAPNLIRSFLPSLLQKR